MNMARNRLNEFDDDLVELAGFAKCLAHPARVAIIDLLQRYEEMPCRAIVEELPLAQPTVSQHLKALVDGGLIRSRDCGAHVCYRLNSDRIRDFCRAFQQAVGTAPPMTERKPFFDLPSDCQKECG
jgi:DNA-binding transcriptional ArsR family regulator